jgi:biotin transporter BioY
MTLDTFLMGLLLASTLTGLCTEAIKTLLTEHNIKYYSNTLAGIVALVLSASLGICYLIITDTLVTAQITVYLVALTFMAWLCAMVGYDKVIQAIAQFRSGVRSEQKGE